MSGMIALGIIGLLLVLLAAVLTWAILKNLLQGERYRKKLAKRLETLRLSRALKMFGVDVFVYLHNEKITDIESQMRNCAACKELDACDDNLNGVQSRENFHFCPNELSLVEMGAQAEVAKASELKV